MAVPDEYAGYNPPWAGGTGYLPGDQYPGGIATPGQTAPGGWNTPTLPKMADPTAPDVPPTAAAPAMAVPDFINQWHNSHDPRQGAGGLFDALKQQYGIDRWTDPKYGLSDNEINYNGSKYKVLGAEGTGNAYWYKPEMNDSAPAVQPVAGLPGPGAPQTTYGGYTPPYASTDPMTGSSYGQDQSSSLGDMMKPGGGPTNAQGQQIIGYNIAGQPIYGTPDPNFVYGRDWVS